MQHDPIAFNKLVRARRSVFPKQFEPGARVPDEIVKEALENAIWAPTHKLTQPWHFVVFTGDGLKKLAEFQSELYKVVSGDNFKQDTYVKLQTQPLVASHIIAIGMKRNESVPEVEEIAAVSCAVQNIYLSITAYGYGGYWTTGGVTYRPQARHFFGLGPDDKLLGFFYIGVVQTPSVAGKREPVETKVDWRNE
ncbi:MAG TPA: nitroreductase [Chitinophagaceae bacterium]|nr:nitroreductase [Chitinophagaceae bacterium]